MTAGWLHEMDGEGRTPLDRAFSSGHRAIAEMMLAQEKEDRTARARTDHPMHRAASLGLVNAVRTLLSVGTNPGEVDELAETPLHKAAREGHAETVRALAPACDLNAMSGMGMTALHWAALAGNAEVVEVLLEFGADPTIASPATDGLNARELAMSMNYPEVVAQMDRKGCVA